MNRHPFGRGCILVLVGGLAACAPGTEVIECSIDVSDVVEVLVVDAEERRARMLRSEWNPIERVGYSEATEYRFELTFPPRADQAELRYRIDRRTLQANRWFVDDEGEPYLDVEATCRALPEEPDV